MEKKGNDHLQIDSRIFRRGQQNFPEGLRPDKRIGNVDGVGRAGAGFGKMIPDALLEFRGKRRNFDAVCFRQVAGGNADRAAPADNGNVSEGLLRQHGEGHGDLRHFLRVGHLNGARLPDHRLPDDAASAHGRGVAGDRPGAGAG